MTAKMVMMKIVEIDTPANMLDTVVKTLLCEINTYESILYRFRTLLSGALIQTLMPPATNEFGNFYDVHRTVWQYINSSRALINGWATLFISMYNLAEYKMYMYASRLTSNQIMIQTLLSEDTNQMKILTQFGKIARLHVGTDPGSNNHVKRLVQNFFDTAGDWDNYIKRMRLFYIESLFSTSPAPKLHRQNN
jgi:hypothetical protein